MSEPRVARHFGNVVRFGAAERLAAVAESRRDLDELLSTDRLPVDLRVDLEQQRVLLARVEQAWLAEVAEETS